MICRFISLILIFVCSANPWALAKERTVTVGSKRFIESQVLAEVLTQHLKNRGFTVEKKAGLGGTFVAYRALKEGAIDFYVEYTGTLAEAIYKTDLENFVEIQKRTAQDDLKALEPLGFDNSYCIVVTSELFASGIQKISDLNTRRDLKGGVSAEFRRRQDGWPKMSQVYELPHEIVNIENPMGYQALADKNIDFAEAYSTDAIVQKMNFKILKDDRNFFRTYHAFILSRTDLPESVFTALAELNGQLDNSTMMAMNASAMAKQNLTGIAQNFLKARGLMKGAPETSALQKGFDWKTLGRRTLTHLFLTFWSVLLAALVALPLGLLISKKVKIAPPVLGFVGVLQTIPSIALLSFMIPLFGIGVKPALAGLLLYSLLPVLRNTYTAFHGIDPRLISVAKAIGLEPRDIFFSVTLPLSLPTIFAGLRTAATINIGTATLAAFIGAGGLGEPIVTGLAMNDSSIILEGAIPAALLAILVDSALGFTENRLTKKL